MPSVARALREPPEREMKIPHNRAAGMRTTAATVRMSDVFT
jgi:hypothetical protein